MKAGNGKMIVLKRGAILFTIFCGVVVLLIGFSLIFETKNADSSSLSTVAMGLILYPAIIIRRWLFEIPGAELDYHYYSEIGAIDYIGLSIFYIIVCFLIAWCWTVIRSGKSVV